MYEEENVSRDMMGKPEGKRPFGRPGRDGRIKLKINVKEIGEKGVDLIQLPIGPDGLFVSQRTGSHSAGISCTIHELLCL